jgi:chaperone required for assembly of F1-ATPase
MLERAERELALMFVRASGIIHQAQPPETQAKVKALALELDDYGLAGLAFGTSLFGSAVLAFAVQRGWVSGEQAWELSRLDEAYQEEKWGVDEEAAERNARLRLEAVMLERWFKALA